MTILFYPEPLKSKPLSRVYTMCNQFGFKYHNDPAEPHDVHMFWSYTKHSIAPDHITIGDSKCINRGCWDISKEKVTRIFDNITIDPLTYIGFCVEKMDRQGAHHGHRLIRCPAQPKPGYIYQKYIEDKEAGLFVKYGIYYHDGISLIVKSFKPSAFKSSYVKHEIIDKREFFSEESERIFNNKCRDFGVNYACIEFLNDNGTPVIIDVNNVMGGGHVPALTGSDIEQEIHMAFHDFIVKRAAND